MNVEADPNALVAHPKHTVRFIAALMVVATLTAYRASKVTPTPSRGHVAEYLVLLTLEWILFGFAWLGLRGRGTRIGEIIGGRWRSARDVGITFIQTAVFWVLAHFALDALKRGLAVAGQSTLGDESRTHAILAPHGAVESALWVLLSLSAGFCEEFVFRGYLQRQLGAMLRHRVWGIVAAALFFGIGHAYQGWRSVVVISAYGLMFGLLAHFARSLRPGMIAHAWQDISAGLFGG